MRIEAGGVRCDGADGSPGAEVRFVLAQDSSAALSSALEPALRGALSSAADAKTAFVFELATELCRFQVVPWVHGLHSREDRRTLARSRFEAVYGLMAREWSVELCEGGFGRGGLAVAVPSVLPAAIARACLDTGATAAQIRPACSAGIHKLLRKAGARASWLVVPDGDHVFVGNVSRRGWIGASSLHENGHGFFRPLGDLLVRESLLAAAGSAEAPVLICVPAQYGPARAGRANPAQPPPLSLEAGGQRWALEWVGS